jgi:hypothetical protein
MTKASRLTRADTHPAARQALPLLVSTDVLKAGVDACLVRRVPVREIEAAVIDQVRALIRTPEIVVRTWRAAKMQDADAAISENDVLEALQRLDPVWEEGSSWVWGCWIWCQATSAPTKAPRRAFPLLRVLWTN